MFTQRSRRLSPLEIVYGMRRMFCTFEIKIPLYFIGKVVGNPHKPKEMIGGRLESWYSDSRMALRKK